ncbi:unnamed protein product [Sphenostylis stenocarpa]|uniref:Uncharacterized protein n=1 Tax=Sphenostylis stenocarpa TaxID=92480 RepID=A0AA86VVI0_9FABA|nr:unnamed protein product [Sphenostylis stenocarpa]
MRRRNQFGGTHIRTQGFYKWHTKCSSKEGSGQKRKNDKDMLMHRPPLCSLTDEVSAEAHRPNPLRYIWGKWGGRTVHLGGITVHKRVGTLRDFEEANGEGEEVGVWCGKEACS